MPRKSWRFALATSLFSAMNERELRQRRADLQALVDVGARLDDVSDPVRQSRDARPASTRRSASPGCEKIATWAGVPLMIWLAIVPEPENESRNSTSAPAFLSQCWRNSGNTSSLSGSARMLNP